MTSLASRPLRSAGLLGLLVAALMFGCPRNAAGQVWLQTARVLTPLEDGPTRAFLDTLVQVMKRKNVMVKRSPDAKERMKISELRNTLIDEAGIGLGSANHAFIDYRFTLDSGTKLKQEITNIYFVFRPGPNQADIPVMHINAQKPWVERVIHQKGTSLRTNQAALILFQHHLGFSNIARQEDSQVVEIGGRTVRKKFDERKQALIQRVQGLMYN